MTKTHDEKISIIGLGRLGAPIAACLAAKGFEVIGVDTNPQLVQQINAGHPPVYETGLDQMLTLARPRLRATTDTISAVRDTDITFILVPTPSESDGGFSLAHVLSACGPIGRGLSQKQGFHLVVVVSTVMPGATGGPVCQALEASSGKHCGQDFGLCYSPEFVALGSVIRDYLNPDFILIGQSEAQSGQLLASIYDRVCRTPPPSMRMNFTNAELAKIAVNSFVTTKITFANTLAGICQQLPGADVDQVTTALGLDSRIGKKYLKGGVGYGGPCFPRDNRALARVAHQTRASAELVEAVDRANRQQVERLATLIKAHLPSDGVAGVLGLAYKPCSDVTEQSQGLMLARRLTEEGWTVVAHDPVATLGAGGRSSDTIHVADAVQDCIDASDVVIIMTPWPPYHTLTDRSFCRDDRRRTVIDPWRILAGQSFGNAVRYVAGGVGPAVVVPHQARCLSGLSEP